MDERREATEVSSEHTDTTTPEGSRLSEASFKAESPEALIAQVRGFLSTTEGEPYVYVPISKELIENLGMDEEWSESPVFVKVTPRDDGTAEMWFQKVAPH